MDEADGGDSAPTHGLSRRRLLGTTFGLGLALHRSARAQDDDPKNLRPQTSDRFVFAGGDRKGAVIGPADLLRGDAPVTAYPMDARTRVVRDGSRLNQVLLLQLDPGDLAAETRARAAGGIVGYSAVCTHTGCDVWEWQPESRTIKCPCHFSEFDLRDGARVLNGPAPRRLPGLPLRLVDGALTAAGGFVGRPGFQQEGG